MKNLFIFICILVLFAGCHASREVQKSKVVISTDIKTDIAKHKTDSVTTNSVRHDSSITKTSEWLDTTLSVPYKDLVFDKDPTPGSMVKVPVKFKRQSETKSYANLDENKKEVAVTDVKKEVVESSKTTSISKNTETKGQNWAMWLTIGGVIVVIIVIAAIVLAKKFKWLI